LFGLAGATIGFGVGELIEEEAEPTRPIIVEAASGIGSIAVNEEVVVSDEVFVTDENLKEGFALIGFGAGALGASGIISGSRRRFVNHFMSLKSGWTPEDGPSLAQQKADRLKCKAEMDSINVGESL